MPYAQEKLKAFNLKVIEAFKNITCPKGLITVHECEECFEVRKTFSNKEWKEITPKILQENYDKLPLFSPEAFHFFIPAYLIYSSEHFVFEDVCEFTLYILTPDKDIETQPTWWQERFKYFTSEQFNLIYEFLDLALAEEEFFYHKTNIERGKKRLKEFVEPTLKRRI